MFLVKRDNFNKTYIIKGLITALIFSAFIYLAHFDINLKSLNTILGLVSIYLLLKIDRKSLVYCGFFVGVLWFYWVGNSFEYYGIGYLSFLVVLVFGFTYALLFYFIAIFDFIVYRAFFIFILSFIHPLGFNWFMPELVFINSYFDTSKISFGIILIALCFLIEFKSYWKFVALLPLVFIFTNNSVKKDEPNIKIAMPQLNLKQDVKWNKSKLSEVIDLNFKVIEKAIEEKKDLVILPETSFPVVLNKEEFLFSKLIKLSKDIDIIVGGLYFENKSFYNVTYHFSKDNIEIAKKVVLVPFGEEIPLPKFMVDFINDVFYGGAEDYKKADKATNFDIKGIKFRNAICYEATSEEIYKNLDGIKYVIATSNNAWFTPSIQPTLQKLLLQYYSRKYNITIFHSINGSDNYVISP